jgi:GNAT superfamily N-acetyltransferase
MKKSTVNTNAITDELSRAFDYTFDGTTEFEPPVITALDRATYLDTDFSIGLIVGPSGSGKSTILKEFGEEEHIEWNPNEAVCSHFENAEDAQERLSSVGFNTIPAWMRPYHVLSNGEQFRADLARRLKDGAVIDEYTSVVDRNVAKSCSYATRRYIDSKGIKKVIFATCHYDIIEWLQPDWVFDTATGQFTTRGSLRRPEINMEIVPCSRKAWEMFRNHHYLSGDLNQSSRCYLAIWNDIPVGFNAIISFPSGTVKNAWRGHRTVILPDFQGMGLGTRFSDAIGEIMLAEGKRYFSKTAHPRLGEWRNASPKWRPTVYNMKDRADYDRLVKEGNLPNPRSGSKNASLGELKHNKKYSYELMMRHKNRVCYAHEYVGDAGYQ